METVLQMFAARHGVEADDVLGHTARIGIEQCGRLQNELSHYERGWTDYQWTGASEYASAEQATAAAHAAYEKMVAWNASLGAISRQEYVNGFVDSWQPK